MSNLELNKGDNFIFGIDVSSSMETRDCPNRFSRIEFLREKAIQFAIQASKYEAIIPSRIKRDCKVGIGRLDYELL
jgi:hypothetical protein